MKKGKEKSEKKTLLVGRIKGISKGGGGGYRNAQYISLCLFPRKPGRKYRLPGTKKCGFSKCEFVFPGKPPERGRDLLSKGVTRTNNSEKYLHLFLIIGYNVSFRLIFSGSRFLSYIKSQLDSNFKNCRTWV